MKLRLLLLALLGICSVATAQNNDSITLRRIYSEALTNGKCYRWLETLTSRYTGRLSGSAQAAGAVDYVRMELNRLGLDSAVLQEVMVPHWVRGAKEQGWIQNGGRKTPVNICALGGSVATPPDGISGSVVVVHDWEEMEKMGAAILKDKIVFMNHPMIPTFIQTFEAYGEAARYRYGTAMRAAKYGAKGVIVRSMTLALDDYPHTGAMGYSDTLPKIPACAISTMGAELLSKMLDKDRLLEAGFILNCRTLPDTLSHNVIGEIRGREFPDEIVLVGGHLDAWDIGDGAHDDGAGVVQSMEVLRIIKALGMQPKRTIRCVAFMNEENGGKGADKYAALAKVSGRKHIAAIESDAGGFAPRGFTFKGDSLMREKVMDWQKLFYPYLLREWKPGYGGADINKLEDQGTLLIGFMPDSQRYFDYHHAATDTFDKINKRELELGAASMAALAWLLSEYGVQ